MLLLYEHYEKAFSSIPNKTQGIVVVVYIPALKRFVAIPTATVTLLSANSCNNKNSNIYWKNPKDFQLKLSKAVSDNFFQNQVSTKKIALIHLQLTI